MSNTTCQLDSVTKVPKQQLQTNGAGHVTVGPSSVSRNRNINAANSTYARSTNSATWAAGTHVSYIRITPVIASGATPLAGDILGYAVINAPSEATANSWLADTGSASADVQYKPIVMGTPCEFTTVLGEDFTGEITIVDILPITTGRFVVEAN